MEKPDQVQRIEESKQKAEIGKLMGPGPIKRKWGLAPLILLPLVLLSLVWIAKPLLNAATFTETFDDVTRYTYNNAKIIVDGGVAKLKNLFAFIQHSTSGDFTGSHEADLTSYQTNKIAVKPDYVPYDISLTKDLVAYWNFDETAAATTAIDSVGGYALTANSTVAVATGGKFSNAASFQNSGAFEMSSNHSSFSPGTSDFTVSAWINSAVIGGDYIVYMDTSGNSSNYKLELAAGSTVRFTVTEQDGTAHTAIGPAISSATWYHVVGVRRGTAVEVYVNCASSSCAASATAGVALPGGADIDVSANATGLKVGNIGPAGGTHFDGLIDEVGFWRRALSSSEIYSLASAVRSLKPSKNLSIDIAMPGLVNYWNFEDGGSSQTLTDIIGAQNGTLGANSSPSTDDPTWTTSSRSGSYALNFDGDDSVILPASVAQAGTGNFTVSAWTYFIKDSIGKTIIASKRSGQAGSETGYVLSYDNGNYARFFIDTGTAPSPPDSNYTAGAQSQVLTTGWHHLTGVFVNGQSISLYVDGVLAQKAATSLSGDFSSAYQTKIGNASGGGNAFFKGAIDDVAFFNRALSAEEIMQIYTRRGSYVSGISDVGGGTPTWESIRVKKTAPYGEALEKPPVAYWKFDEASGTTFTDIASGFVGTLTGTVTRSDDGPNTAFNTGKSISLDGAGTSFIAVPDNSTLDLIGSYTISLWFNRGTDTDGGLVDKNPGSSCWRFAVENSKLVAAHYDSTGYTLTGSTTVSASAWHHGAVTFNSATNTLSLYLDGKSDATPITTSGVVVNNSQSVVIGSEGYSPAGLAGKIDEVAIYDYPLSPSQIAALASGQKRPRVQKSAYPNVPAVGEEDYEKNISAIWHLNNDALDSTNRNHGTFNGYANDFIGAFTHGVNGPALSFDGTDDSLSFTNSTLLVAPASANPNFAVSAWIRTATNITSKAILSKDTSGSNGYELAIDASGRAIFKKSSTATSATGPLVNDGAWHHVVGVARGASGMFVYVDGLEAGTNASTTAFSSGASTLYIGRSSAGAYFQGDIDEVAIFKDGTLSAAQVMDLYKRGAASLKFQVQTDTGPWSGGSVSNKIPGLVGLWHFNETTGNPQDASGNGNHVTSMTAGVAYSQDGISGGTYTIDGGNSHYMSIPDSASLDSMFTSNGYTMSFWIKPTSLPGNRIIMDKFTGADAFIIHLLSTGLIDFDANGNNVGSTQTPMILNQWNHYAVSINCGAAGARIYVNGKLDHNHPFASNCTANNAPFVIGRNGSVTFVGAIDELAMFNRQLSGSEVWRLYESSRYAVNSEGDSLDGVNKEPTIHYRAQMDMIKENISPDFTNVDIYVSGRYPTDNPTITNTTAQAFTYLTSFSETVTLNSQNVKYILSPNNGTNWYYYNSGWVTSNGTYAQSSTAATINTNIATFDDATYGAAGFGQLLVRAFLNSDGSATPDYSQFSAGYETGSIAVNAPNGSEIWKAGSAKAITWTHTGTVVPSDMILEYATDGISYSNQIATGVSAGSHNQDKMSGIKAVWKNVGFHGGAIADASNCCFVDSATGTDTGVAHNTNGTGFTVITGHVAGSNAVTFDGVDDSIEVPDSADLSPTTGLTAELWFKTSSTQNTKYLVYKGSSYYVYVSNTGVRFLVTGNVNSIDIGHSMTYSDNAWHHVAATFDGDWQRLYVDGVLRSSQDVASTTVSNSASPFYLGASNSEGTNNFSGSLDDVSIFDRALSTSEIKALYDAGASAAYIWSVPSVTSNTMKVRVRSSAAPAISDTSNNNFTIANLDLTAPNGAEQIKTNSNYAVTWTPTAYVPSDLELHYSSDGGINYSSSIATGLAVSGTGALDPVSIGSGLIVLRLNETGTPATVADTAGSNTVNTNGSPTFSAGRFNNAINFNGTSQYLQMNGWDGLTNYPFSFSAWIKTSSGGPVMGLFDSADGNNFMALDVGSTATLCVQNANCSSNSVKVVNDNQWHHIAVVFTNNSSRTIYVDNVADGGNTTNVGWPTGSAPGGARIGIGRQLDLTPSGFFSGSMDDVAIFTKALTVGEIASLYNAGASYTWAVPDVSPFSTTGSAAVMVRLRSASVTELSDESAAPFKVVKLDVTAPNGTEYWTVGTNQNITWSKSSLLTDFKVEYSTNGGSSWQTPLSSNTGDVSSFAWNNIPVGAVGNDTVVRVCAQTTGYTTICDTSDAPFVVPSIAVVKPNATTDEWQVGRERFITWTQSVGVPDDLAFHYDLDGDFSGGASSPVSIVADYNSPKDTTINTASSLQAYWRFDGNLNDSQGSNNGTPTGNVTFGGGPFGNALSFDSTGYVTLSDNANLSPGSGDWTFSAWVNVKANPCSNCHSYIYRNHAPTNNTQTYVSVYGNTRQPTMYFIDTASNQLSMNAGASGPALNTWYHFAGVRSGTSIYLYIDGKLANSGNGGFVNINPQGGNPPYFGGNLNGLIDEASVFNRALTQGEIARLAIAPAKRGLAPDPANVPTAAALYHFDAAEYGGVANAASVAEASGTYNGAAVNTNGTGLSFTKGILGGAMYFDGLDDSVTVTGLPSPGGSDFAYSFWIKMNRLTSQVPFTRGTGAYTYAIFSNAVSLNFRDDASNAPTVSATPGLTTGTWYHFVLQKIGTSAEIYKDGVRLATSNGSPALGNFNLSGQALSLSSTSSSALDGALDEFAFYTRSLTPTEIALLAGKAAYKWTVPDAPSATMKVRIRSASQTNITDQSDANFLVDKLQFTQYIGGEILPYQNATGALLQVNLDWYKSGAGISAISPVVDIYDSINGGSAFTNTSLDYDNDGSIGASMVAIGALSSQVKMLIQRDGGSSIFDITPYDFSIVDVDITSPNGTEKLRAGDVKMITWNNQGSNVPADLSLEYTTNGTDWTAISGSDNYNSPKGIDANDGTGVSELKGYWNFDNTTFSTPGTVRSTASDSLGGSSTVALSAGNSRMLPGLFGNALALDGGTSSATITSTAALSPTGAITVATWFKNRSTTAPMVVKNNSYILRCWSNPSCIFSIINGAGTQDDLDAGHSGYYDNNWHHIAGTFDGDIMRLYYDGTEIANKDTALTNIQANSNAVVLGNYAGGVVLGAMDETAIFNRALSAGEIARLALKPSEQGLTPDPMTLNPAPTAAWHFDTASYGAIANGTTITAAVGTNGTTINPNGSGLQWAKGILGNAIYFDGIDDTISVAHGASVAPATNMTLAAWVKTPLVGNRDIMTKANVYGLGLSNNPNIVFSHRNSASNLESTSRSFNYADNNWHHVGATFTAVGVGTSFYTIYVDGVPIGGTTLSNHVDTSGVTQTFYIGSTQNSSNFFLGSIDEPAVFNRAVSAREMQILAGKSAFTWTLPSVGSSTVKVRIKSTSVANLIDQSDADFKISQLQMTSPNGGELMALNPSNSATVTWSSDSGVSAVDLLKAANGSTYTNAYTNDPNDGTMPVNLTTVFSNTPSTTAKFRLLGNPEVEFTDDSDYPFSLIDVDMTYPNGTENFQVGRPYFLTWNTSGSNIPHDLFLEYTLNGADWNAISGAVDLHSPKWIDANDGTGTTDLKGFWRFDEATTTAPGVLRTSSADSSATGATLTLVGGPIITPGLYGNAILLDGADDYMSMADSAALSPGAGDFTISAWANFKATGTQVIWSNVGSVANNAVTFLVVASGGQKARITYRDGSANTAEITGSTAITSNVWHHMVGIRRGTTVELYLDGILDGTNTNASLGTINISDGATPAMGRSSGSSTNFLNGLLDEVSVFNRALSIKEIHELGLMPSQLGKSPDPANIATPTFLWHADEAEYGAAGLTNNATITPTIGPSGTVANPNDAELYWTKGILGGAFLSNLNTDYITFGDWNGVEDKAALSASVWVKFNQAVDVSTNVNVLNKVSVFGLSRLSNGTMQYSVTNSSATTANGLTTTTYSDTNWHHVAGVYNGTDVRVYVDGVLGSTVAALTGNTQNNGLAFTVGRTTVGLNGQVDEAAIWDRALTPVEIQILAGRAAYQWTVPDVGSATAKVRVKSASVSTLVDASDADLKIEELTMTAPNGGEIFPLHQADGNLSAVSYAWQNNAAIGNVTPMKSLDNGNTYTAASGAVPISNNANSINTNLISATPNSQLKARMVGATDTGFHDESDYVYSLVDLDLTTLNAAEDLQAGTQRFIAWTSQGSNVPHDMTLEYTANNGSNWNAITGAADLHSPKGVAAADGNSSELVRYWSLDDKTMQDSPNTHLLRTTAADGLGGALTLTLTANARFVPGIYGNALYFDGLSTATGSDTGLPAGNASMTMSAWIKTSNSSTGIIALYGNPYRTLYVSVGRLVYVASGQGTLTSATSGLANDQWHHVVIVHDSVSNIQSMYIDGVLDANTTNFTGTNTALSGTSFRLGTDNSLLFRGLIDEPAIFNRALTPAEIAELALTPSQLGKSPDPASVATPTFLWHMDEAQYGSAGLGNAATITPTTGPNGTVFNVASPDFFWNKGILNGSLLINQDTDYISFGDWAGVEDQAAVSLSTWIKFTNALDGGSQNFFFKTNVVGLSRLSNETIQFAVTNSSATQVVALTTAAVADTNWHHVAGVYNGTDARVYLDGQLGGTIAALTGNTQNNSNNLTIGGNANGVLGMMDEAAIWNRGLTPVEVQILAGKAAFQWTVPDSASTTVKVRVKSASKPTIIDQSDANLKISKLEMTAPNGGEIIAINNATGSGNSYSVLWSNDAAISNIDLQKSNDGGMTYTNFATNSTNDGSFSTNILNEQDGAVSKNRMIRVIGVSPDTNVFDATDYPFSLVDLDITSPNGANDFQVGTPKFITWNTQGSNIPHDLALEYTSNGTDWNAISGASDLHSPKSMANLVGYWRFDGLTSAGTNDDVADGTPITATLNNGAKMVPGLYGNAILFDGINDRVNTAYTTAVGTNNLTYSAWFKSGISHNGGIMGQRLDTVHQFYMSQSSTAITFFEKDATNTRTCTSASGFNDNAWHHAAMSRSSADTRLYVDGLLQCTVSTTQPNVLSGTTALVIGALDVANTWPYNGMIDEPAVFNRALSAGEIAELAMTPSQLGKGPDPMVTDQTSVAGVWHLDDLTESSTSAASNVTLTGAVIDNGGLLGKALRFDGVNDEASVSSIPAGTTRSYSAWVKFSNVDATTEAIIFNNNVLLTRNALTNKFRLSQLNLSNTIESTTGVTAGQWYQVSATYDSASSVSKLYVNGNLEATGSSISLTPGTNATFGRSNAGSNPLEGFIDEIGMWNRVLSPTEVKQLAGKAAYQWTVPNSVSNTVKVRVKSAGVVTSLIDQSDADFKIARLAFTAPTGGAVLRMGATANNITWDAAGSGTLPTDMKIEYSNDGTTWTQVTGATNIDPTGVASFNWNPIPTFGTEQTSMRLRMTSASNANFYAESALFTIGFPTLTFTAPVLNEVVPFGNIYNIAWTITPASQGTWSNGDFKIEYSVDGTTWPGGTQVLVTGSAENGGPVTSPFQFSFPADAVSTTARIRISDNSAPNGVSISSSFKITGSFVLTKPNGNEKWAIGFPHTIAWNTSGTIDDVKIITYDSDPNTPVTTIINSTPNTGSYSWTPTLADAKTGLKIRVMNVADNSVYTETAGIFTVSSVQVGNPAARLLAGAVVPVTWTHVGVTNVKLESSILGDFSDAVTISGCASVPAGDGTCNMTVPSDTTMTFKVRAVDANAPAVGDLALAVDPSDADSTIYGTITLNNPATSVDWSSGQPHDITWTTSPANANVIPNIKIVTAKNGNFNDNSVGNIVTIIASTPNHNVATGSGKYTWTPNFTSTSAKVRVSDADDTAPVANQDQKDSGFFTVSGISITSPSGGEVANVNGNFSITFGYTGTINNADFHYSPDGGTTWNPIASNVNVPSNPWTYNWTNVPNDISTNMKVRVRDSNNQTTYAISNGAFSIKGVMQNLQVIPNVNVGASHTIQWETLGSMPDEILEYSVNGTFSDAVQIASLTGLSGAQTAVAQSYNWNPIPNAIGTATRVRIRDNTTRANGSPANMSITSNAFSISPVITITGPVSSDKWAVNESRNIAWTTTGTVANLKIEYVPVEGSQNGNPYAVINSVANAGTYAWPTIPDIVTNGGQNPNADGNSDGSADGDRDILVKIRITDNSSLNAGHPTTVAESDPFTVQWYQTDWKVKDVDSGALIQGFSVADNSGWSVTGDTINQLTGIIRYYKYGTYTSNFSKTGYAASTDDGWVADQDQTRTVFLQNDATASVEVTVKVQYNYDLASDTFNFTWWIEKGGILQTNANLLYTGRIEVYENGSDTILQTLNDANGADSKGTYEVSWPTSGIDTSKLYFAKGIIAFGNANAFKASGVTIDVREKAAIQTINTGIAAVQTAATAIQATTSSMDTKIGTVNDANSLMGKTQALIDAVGTVNDAAGAASMVGVVKDAAQKSVTILDEVQNKIPDLIKANTGGSKGGRGRILSRNPRVPLGGTAAIKFQFDTAAAPTVDIYDPTNRLIVNHVVMREEGNTGIYHYNFKVPETFAKGEYTVIVKEAVSGFMDSMILQVISSAADEDKMGAALSSASSQATNAANDAKKAAVEASSLKALLGEGGGDSMSSQLSEVAAVMNGIKASMATLFGNNSSGSGQAVTINTVHTAVLDVMSEIRNVASREGINLDSVYEGVSAQQETAKQIQNMVVATEAAAKTTQEILEKAQDKPVMTTWFENPAV